MAFGERIIPFPTHRIPGGGNMALRRSVLDRVGYFNTQLGRSGNRLIGGEESDLFERLRQQGMKCYYVPRAVMYHIIGEEKLNKGYFSRLAYNTGVSQRSRAELHNRVVRLYIFEVAKWIATLLLMLIHRPAQSKYLLLMRYHISRGILQK
jgi:GT2 family glycosyltransferase